MVNGEITSTETIRLIRHGGEGGGRGYGGGGKREIIHLSLYRPPITVPSPSELTLAFRWGSDESHFNVSLIVRDKVTRECPQATNFDKEKGEPKRNRAKALLLISLTAYR